MALLDPHLTTYAVGCAKVPPSPLINCQKLPATPSQPHLTTKPGAFGYRGASDLLQ